MWTICPLSFAAWLKDSYLTNLKHINSKIQ